MGRLREAIRKGQADVGFSDRWSWHFALAEAKRLEIVLSESFQARSDRFSYTMDWFSKYHKAIVNKFSPFFLCQEVMLKDSLKTSEYPKWKDAIDGDLFHSAWLVPGAKGTVEAVDINFTQNGLVWLAFVVWYGPEADGRDWGGWVPAEVLGDHKQRK